MNYQLLALDLDGTLTNSRKEITPSTRDALIDIQKKGKKVVLASGRPSQGVLPLAEELHLGDYGSYILSYNGGRITDCRSGEIIYSKYLPNDVAAPLLEIVKKYPGIDILAYTDTELISGGDTNEYSEKESFINHMPITKVDDFVSYVTKNNNNKFLITGEPELIQEVKAEAEKQFHSYLSIYFSDPFFLEIMPQGIDKAHSLTKLLTSIGFSTDAMICCGDGYNDLTMIETAGLGVAMENAQPLVKESADYITKSNDEDGVLHVINEFMR